MNRNLTTPPARLLGVFLLLVIAATGGAAAAASQLLESSKAFLPETAIAAMEQGEPDVRPVLGKIEIHALTVKVEGRLETGCTGLISVSIGNSVTSIEGGTFYGCTGLASVYCEGNAPHPSEIEPLFDGSPLVIVYYLPGAAGWASLYSGRPTLVRKPVPLYSDWLQSTTLASRYPGASAPADDPDLDGMSNEAEMLAGTDPTESILRLVLERTPRPDELLESDRTPQESEHALYIRTVPGKRYGVHTADLLGQWRLDRIVTATTSQARLVFSKPAADAFYRVILAE